VRGGTRYKIDHYTLICRDGEDGVGFSNLGRVVNTTTTRSEVEAYRMVPTPKGATRKLLIVLI
jgi:hypothetical protein